MKPEDLDDRLVPLAAERVAALAERLAARRARWRSSLERARATSPGALDARYARTGPLGLVRDVPQVGFVVIAALILAGAGTVASRESSRSRAAAQQSSEQPTVGPTQQPSDDTSLGPEVGQRTTAYEVAAAQTVTAAVAGSPDSTRVALISFRAYRTPAQVDAMLSGYTVRRVFLRAQAGGRDAAQLPVDIHSNLLVELRRAYASTAKGRLDAQRSYQGYVDTLTVTTKDEQAFKNLYAAFAKSTGIEAKAYKSGCACVYAAVVEGKASRLQLLRARPAVRAVEVAGSGLKLTQLQVLPLLPEVTGIVPQQQAAVEQP